MNVGDSVTPLLGCHSGYGSIGRVISKTGINLMIVQFSSGRLVFHPNNLRLVKGADKKKRKHQISYWK